MQQLPSVITSLVGSSKSIAVACSGGVDSTFLAIFARQILPKDTIITALIVDHRLRKNSTIQAERTAKTMKQYGIKAKVLTWNHENITTAIEEKARYARYRLITQYCKCNGIKKVLLGHHIEDKIETFLMSSIRGVSLSGITSMRQIHTMHEIDFLRPMLYLIEKHEIISYMQSHEISWEEDETNEDIQFTRNKIRHALNLTSSQKYGILHTVRNLERIANEIHAEVEIFFKQNAILDTTIFLPNSFLNLTKEKAVGVLKKAVHVLYPFRFQEFRCNGLNGLYAKLLQPECKATLAHCMFIKNHQGIVIIPEYKKLYSVVVEANIEVIWNDMMKIQCNRKCTVVPFGLHKNNLRIQFGITHKFIDVAHLPVFCSEGNILAIPHLCILPEKTFKCTV